MRQNTVFLSIQVENLNQSSLIDSLHCLVDAIRFYKADNSIITFTTVINETFKEVL